MLSVQESRYSNYGIPAYLILIYFCSSSHVLMSTNMLTFCWHSFQETQYLCGLQGFSLFLGKLLYPQKGNVLYPQTNFTQITPFYLSIIFLRTFLAYSPIIPLFFKVFLKKIRPHRRISPSTRSFVFIDIKFPRLSYCAPLRIKYVALGYREINLVELYYSVIL